MPATSTPTRAKRELWSGRIGFILANIAAAVGLGSIWKFPYEVGTNGGGAFVLFYLVGLALIVLPLMLAELALGRRGRSDAIRSILNVASAAAASPRWGFVGAIGVVAGFLILSFYSVIGGWAIAYLVDTVRIGLPAGDAQAAQARFDALLASPLKLALYHLCLHGGRLGDRRTRHRRRHRGGVKNPDAHAGDTDCRARHLRGD